MRFRLSGFYIAVFTVIGFHLPFWPVWLSSQGFTATEIGILVAAKFWIKLFTNPIVGQFVDKRGQRRGTMILLSLLSFITFSLFFVIEGFWPLLILSIVAGGAFSAMVPLGENLTMLIAYARNLDYGRLRLWGSLSFIASAIVMGQLLTTYTDDLILWAILAGLALMAVSCLYLPEHGEGRPAAPPPPFRQLLKVRLFWLFVAATALISSSHMVYYGFATLHWQKAGIPSNVIGWLWAEGVLAEVCLFAFSGLVVAKVGATRLLIIGAIGATVRWTMTGLSTDLSVLVASQALHAFSFGACHLAAMHFMTQAIPISFSARAQAVYSSIVMGALPGIAMVGTGILYDEFAGGAFLAGGALSVIGGLLAIALHHKWNKKPLPFG